MSHPEHFLFFGKPRDGEFVFDPDDSRHMARSLRLREGDPVQATDGSGTIYECRLRALSPAETVAAILSMKRAAAPVPRLTLVVGIPERESFERLLELVAPLGVARIVPAECGFCQSRWWATKWEKQAERFRRKMIAGVKQALSPFLPSLDMPVPFAQALESADPLAYMADERGESLMTAAHAGTGSAVTAFVGPPGGFTDEELDTLQKHGARAVALSPLRLRTELASAVICAMLMGRAPDSRATTPAEHAPGDSRG